MRVVGFLVALIALPLPVFAADGVLYVVPERGSYSIGETFDVHVLADTDNESINAAEAEINYNPTALSVEKLSTDGSVLSSWPTPPEFDKEKGLIRFSGWTKEAFSGRDGLLITITFKALRNMAGEAYLASGSMLAADGQGTNIITSLRSGVYTVEPRHTVTEVPEGEDIPHPVNFSDSPDIDPPVLTEYPVNINAGDRIVLRGTTVPNARISIWVEKGDDDAKDSTIWSAADGSFVYISDQGVDLDLYRIWAEVHNYDDLKSAVSKKVTLNVRAASAFSASVASAVSLMSSLLPLLLLIIFGGLAFGYLLHMHKIEKIRRSRVRENTHF